MPEKWQCSVCGYRHEGADPLPRCPRCGTDGTRFIPRARAKFNLLWDLRASLVPHAVASHFPSGLVPVSLLFLILGWVTGEASFFDAVVYLLAVVWVAIPVLVASGIYDWRKRFGGIRATIFYKKITLACVLFLCDSFVLARWFLQPQRWRSEVLLGGPYPAVLSAMVVLIVLLGHYGGKLAFQWKKRKW